MDDQDRWIRALGPGLWKEKAHTSYMQRTLPLALPSFTFCISHLGTHLQIATLPTYIVCIYVYVRSEGKYDCHCPIRQAEG